ncbi:hypothetical protein ACFPAG_16375 [Vogesella sp. GCM10023246]|uniref:Uncharacterized protein n=1 Tax=Vogesella oryzagri TaxID=3160864 RepID=A0ABV1M7M2_9NEIS
MKKSLFRYFPFGLLLSAPLLATFSFGFSGQPISNDSNNVLLLIMSVIGVLSLPGSVILLAVGFIAAFSGKTGGTIAVICMALSVANAHFMAMVYARAFSAKKPTVAPPDLNSPETSFLPRLGALLAVSYVMAVLGGIVNYYAKTGDVSFLKYTLLLPSTILSCSTALLISWGLWSLRRWAWWLGLGAVVVQISLLALWLMPKLTLSHGPDLHVSLVLCSELAFLVVLALPRTRKQCQY